MHNLDMHSETSDGPNQAKLLTKQLQFKLFLHKPDTGQTTLIFQKLIKKLFYKYISSKIFS